MLLSTEAARAGFHVWVPAACGVGKWSVATLSALTAAQTRFDPTELRVKASATVAPRLENRDAGGHNVNLAGFNLHVSVPPG